MNPKKSTTLHHWECLEASGNTSLRQWYWGRLTDWKPIFFSASWWLLHRPGLSQSCISFNKWKASKVNGSVHYYSPGQQEHLHKEKLHYPLEEGNISTHAHTHIRSSIHTHQTRHWTHTSAQEPHVSSFIITEWDHLQSSEDKCCDVLYLHQLLVFYSKDCLEENSPSWGLNLRVWTSI